MWFFALGVLQIEIDLFYKYGLRSINTDRQTWQDSLRPHFHWSGFKVRCSIFFVLSSEPMKRPNSVSPPLNAF